MKIIIDIGINTIVVLLLATMAFAEENSVEVQQWIESGVPCASLTEDQLEKMGDHYMEQIHPGSAHELMDTMMGGEGSDSLRWMHITMARRFYCQEDIIPMGYGPMRYGGMRTMMGSGMMGVGIMGLGYDGTMMGSWGYGYWGFLQVLYLLLAIGLVVLVYLWIWKLWKSTSAKGK